MPEARQGELAQIAGGGVADGGQLQADASRVLELNASKGVFASDEPAPEEVTLGRQIWDYLELDEN